MPLPIPENSADTRQRLLQAAGEMFAAQGFRQATVRDICEKAEANIAAVNYHFRDKVGLYAAVLKHWIHAAVDRYPSDGGLPPDAPAEQRLAAFIRSFLFRMLDQGTPAWHGQLMAREMTDPMPGVIDSVIEGHMRPQSQLLFAIVRELIGKNATPEQIRRCAFSVVGQCVFYRMCHHVISRMENQSAYSSDQIEELAAHVFRVSLAGIISYRSGASDTSRKRSAAAKPTGRKARA